MIADADVGQWLRDSQRDERTQSERAQISVGFSEHYYCTLKTGRVPLWGPQSAEKGVVRT